MRKGDGGERADGKRGAEEEEGKRGDGEMRWKMDDKSTEVKIVERMMKKTNTLGPSELQQTAKE